jgi:hypothetical protein
MTDSDQLAAALRQDFPSPAPSRDPAWSRPPALRILDCVLAFRRNDTRPIDPRVDAFQRRFPAVESLPQLRALIVSYKSPGLFARDVLDSNEPAPAETLRALLEYLIRMATVGSGSEETRLKAWAACARPQDHLTLQIPGFGLAAFQYLRMLFGANTTRPDLQVGRYVAAVLGRPVSDVEALLLLEEAAPLVPVQLRDLAIADWKAPARVSRA